MPEVSGTAYSPAFYINKQFAKKIYFWILFASMIWCVLVIAAPKMAGMGGVFPDISNFVYIFFSKACHQEDARSFHLWGYKLAVCSRCSVIYFSFLVGVILYPAFRKINYLKLPSLWILGVGCILMLIDALLDNADILKNTFLTRSVTGFILGVILPFYIVPGTISFAAEIAGSLKKKNYKVYE